MLRRFRKAITNSVLLTVLLAAAIGPGLTLHAIGDAMHVAEEDHFDHSFAALGPDYAFELENSCALDHDHDEGHAASVSIACLAKPIAVAEVNCAPRPLVFGFEQWRAPAATQLATIDQPPRLFASI